MTKAHHALTSLLHLFGAGRRVRLRAFGGIGASSHPHGHDQRASEQQVCEGDQQVYGGELAQRWVVLISHLRSLSNQLSRVGDKCAKTVSTLCRNTRRRAITVSILGLVGVFVCTGTALATTPLETPEIQPATAITSASAELHGVLNPAAGGPVEGGTYQFVYRATGSGKCRGSGEVKSTPGIAAGSGREEYFETIAHLTPATEYAVCVIEENNAKAETVESAPSTFTTAPEAPETLSPAKTITAKTAILEGVLNPEAEANAGWYFDYSTEAKCTENALTSPAEPEALVKKQTESKEVSELQPNRKYEFCLVAFNAGGGQSTAGNEVSLMTEPAAPEVSGESASAITTSAATLNAAVNPNNEKTTYFFEYSTSEAEVLASKGTKLAGAPPAAELENFGFQGVGVPTGVLHADTTYFYRVIAKNVTGEEKGTVEHFITAPETPEGLKAEPITESTAMLNGVLNPKATLAGEPETYEFIYRQAIVGCQGPGEARTMPEIGAGGKGEAVKPAELTGLPPGETYTFCLRVRKHSGRGSAERAGDVHDACRGAGDRTRERVRHGSHVG